MAKPMNHNFYGLPCILRHDYQLSGIKEKLQSYQKKSADSFAHFMTNVPTMGFDSFLDIGCGDDYVMKLFDKTYQDPNMKTETGIKFGEVRGIDLYIEPEDYPTVDHADWYNMSETVYKDKQFDAIFINHSLEHAANVYALMEQVVKIHKPGGALFVAVPDGNSEFGYGITSSTTHFSCITEGYLSTTLQRFGYNVQISRREFRTGAPEVWAFAIKH